MKEAAPTASNRRDVHRGQLEVVAAALAFAASVPASKLLLGDVAPLALSGVLYLSAGLLCALLVVLARRAGNGHERNVIRGLEWTWLGGVVLAGGVLAPFLLFLGLRRVSGHAAGLLLNFEAVFTVGIGVLVSGEQVGRRGWIGASGVILGSVLLALPGEAAETRSTSVSGIWLVIAACALWGLDNNLTQRVSMRDARQIVAIKGCVGGTASLVLALAFGGLGSWTAPRLAMAMGVGAVSFGLSIAWLVRGLRRLGVVQTGMLFALAPGFAAILCWLVLHEPLGVSGLLALASMTVGALLLATDRRDTGSSL